MQVHYDIAGLPSIDKAVVTIGTFDGVHTGHRLILEQLRQEASAIGGQTVLVTFHPHPRKVVGNQQAGLQLINTLEERIALLRAQGIDHLVIVPFTQAFAQLTAQQYVQDFLVATFKPAVLVIGYDHRFGHNRQGNYQLLEALQPHFGYRLVEIPAAVLDNITVSSTQIRRALINCQIEAANELLGYPYFFTGTVVQGNKLGRTLGYPTANLQLPDLEKLLPGNGVYAVKASLPQQPASPQLQGMMNIGVRPTVDGKRLVVEVNLFNFNQDIYHQPMQVAVWHYLRGEQKFEGLEALKRQLGVDKEAALAKLG